MHPSERYLSLLKKSLLNDLYIENEARIVMLAYQLLFFPDRPEIGQLIKEFLTIEETQYFAAVTSNKETGGVLPAMRTTPKGTEEITEFRNFSFVAHSMIGRKRMDNLHQCLDRIRLDGIAGDLIETGVWKGGATLFMRGFLAAHGMDDRKVWVADSFDGLPKASLAQDKGLDFSKSQYPYLAIGIDAVKDLFARYELLDEQVQFLKGWFKDTLPIAPIEKLALLRLDGDLYESTMDGLQHLYHKLSPGGFVIVDDYLSFPGCKEAVDDYRQAHGIVDELMPIDEFSAYWRKAAS